MAGEPLEEVDVLVAKAAQSCANCYFSNPLPPGTLPAGALQCRANAPLPLSGAIVAASWPLVSAGDWCGIWKNAGNPAEG